MMQANPDMPFFILGESRNNPEIVINAMPRKDFLKNSLLYQAAERKETGPGSLSVFIKYAWNDHFPFSDETGISEADGYQRRKVQTDDDRQEKIDISLVQRNFENKINQI